METNRHYVITFLFMLFFNSSLRTGYVRWPLQQTVITQLFVRLCFLRYSLSYPPTQQSGQDLNHLFFFFLYCNGVLFRALKKGSCCPISGYLGSRCNGNSLFPLFLSLAPHSAVLHTAPLSVSYQIPATSTQIQAIYHQSQTSLLF